MLHHAVGDPVLADDAYGVARVRLGAADVGRRRVRDLGGRYRITVRVALLVALAVYVPLMFSAERQAADRLAELRGEDPQAYLQVVRREEGFDPYLDAVAEIRGYDDWRAAPPEFLNGRWRLYETRQYVDDGFVPDACTPAVRFSEGRVRMPKSGLSDALHTVQDAQLAVRRADAGDLTHRPAGAASVDPLPADRGSGARPALCL